MNWVQSLAKVIPVNVNGDGDGLRKTGDGRSLLNPVPLVPALLVRSRERCLNDRLRERSCSARST